MVCDRRYVAVTTAGTPLESLEDNPGDVLGRDAFSVLTSGTTSVSKVRRLRVTNV